LLRTENRGNRPDEPGKYEASWRVQLDIALSEKDSAAARFGGELFRPSLGVDRGHRRGISIWVGDLLASVAQHMSHLFFIYLVFLVCPEGIEG
jgi:hypothetical protein